MLTLLPLQLEPVTAFIQRELFLTSHGSLKQSKKADTLGAPSRRFLVQIREIAEAAYWHSES